MWCVQVVSVGVQVVSVVCRSSGVWCVEVVCGVEVSECGV